MNAHKWVPIRFPGNEPFCQPFPAEALQWIDDAARRCGLSRNRVIELGTRFCMLGTGKACFPVLNPRFREDFYAWLVKETIQDQLLLGCLAAWLADLSNERLLHVKTKHVLKKSIELITEIRKSVQIVLADKRIDEPAQLTTAWQAKKLIKDEKARRLSH